LRTKFGAENQGCQVSVSRGITWFFEQEPEGVILEDDTLPSQEFFTFCDALLEKYRDNERVYSISGSYFGSSAETIAEYYFSIYALMWGWATWRNRWANYSLDVGDYDVVLRRQRRGFVWNSYFNAVFRELSNGRIDTWDFQWLLTVWRANAVVCRPKRNLTTNIGFGPNALHTVDATAPAAARPRSSIDLERLEDVDPERWVYPREDRLDEAVWLQMSWKSVLMHRLPRTYHLYQVLRTSARARAGTRGNRSRAGGS
jgi:hypothetical protein